MRPTNTGILGDWVQTILLDTQDRPWIASYNPFVEEGGMSRFNGDGAAWTVLSSVEHAGMGSVRFHDMIKDAAGIMWITSPSGLLKYNPAVGPSSIVRYSQATVPQLPTNAMRDLALAPDGSIWIALWDVTIGVGFGGLARFQPDTGAWQVWTTATGLPWGAQWPGWNGLDSVAIVTDPGGGYTVWFDSDPLGVGTFKNGVFNWFGVPSEVVLNPPPGGPTPIAIYSTASADASGNIWLLTNQGMARRNPNGSYTITGYPFGLTTEVANVYAMTGGRAHLSTFYGDVFQWDGSWSYLGNWGNNNHTYAFAEESDGSSFWVGGIGGAARYHNGSFQQYRLTNTGMVGMSVSTVAFDGAGNAYMNANAGPGIGGFDILHPDGTWSNANNFNYGLGLPWGLPTDDVADMFIRANGHPLLALRGIQGAVEFDGTQYAYLIPQGFEIVKIAEDGLGRVWAARDDGGIYRITGAQTTFLDSTSSPLPAGQITNIIPDPNSPAFVWIVAPSGLARTDGTASDVYSLQQVGLTASSPGYYLTSGDRAQDGTFWLGSGQGLFHFSPQTLQHTQYTPATTTMVSDDVRRVEVAPDASVWVATMEVNFPYPGGLSHFDGKTWTTYIQGSSPLPHNEIQALNSRPTAGGGYEVWVGATFQAIAVITVPPAPSPADLNGDGHVNGLDIAILLGQWTGAGTYAPCPPHQPADLNQDCRVNGLDIALLLGAWTG